MSEQRKVIVFFEHEFNEKGLSFPLVCAWLRGKNDVVTDSLIKHYPDRGTIYVHASVCGGMEPQRHQIAAFECVTSERGTARWMARGVTKSLVSVIECPADTHCSTQTSFWAWLAQLHMGAVSDLFPDGNGVYILRDKTLIGPFSRTANGGLSGSEVLVHEDVAPFKLTIGGRTRVLVDTGWLGVGKTLVVDPRLAVSRQLKTFKGEPTLDWLSRNKIHDLGEVLAHSAPAPGCEWIREELRAVLGAISEGDGLGDVLAKAMLEVPAVKAQVHLAWEQANVELVERVRKEYESAESRLKELHVQVSGEEDKLQKLQTDQKAACLQVVKAQEQIKMAEAKAGSAFDDELKRLAQAPASLALLGAWAGFGGRQGTDSRIRIQRVDIDESVRRVDTCGEAVAENLRRCGVAPKMLQELGWVIEAAVMSGQTLTMRSGFGNLLAEAIALSAGLSKTMWVDTPAGLLEPIDWVEVMPSGSSEYTLVLQSANRSDLGLVLGVKKEDALRRCLGLQPEKQLLVLLLETRPGMTVEDCEIPPGPIIEDRMLTLRSPEACEAMVTWNGNQTTAWGAEVLKWDDFVDEIGQDISDLPLFALPSQNVVLRHCYSAVRAVVGHRSDDARRVFFKYWCLPRLSSECAANVCRTRKEKWATDEFLAGLVAERVDSAE